MANGASRLVQAQNVVEKGSQSDLNAKFANENEVAKNAKTFKSRSAIEHNHSTK